MDNPDLTGVFRLARTGAVRTGKGKTMDKVGISEETPVTLTLKAVLLAAALLLGAGGGLWAFESRLESSVTARVAASEDRLRKEREQALSQYVTHQQFMERWSALNERLNNDGRKRDVQHWELKMLILERTRQ